MYSQYKQQDATGLLRETASQTAGPFVHIGLALDVAGLTPRSDEISHNLLKSGLKNDSKNDANANINEQQIEFIGSVFDGNGDLVRDALIEIWQADSEGNYISEFNNKKSFNGFGRSACDAEGNFRFNTIKPGRVDFNGKLMAPHINVTIFARGINIHLQTRAYFDDEQTANENCPFLNRIPSPERRNTLMAIKEGNTNTPTYRFDIYLQGNNETVFFDY